jgi:hemerythrin-like domain-containing protein
MSDATAPLIDTRDMICVHDVFRRSFGEASGQIASVRDGDIERAEFVAGYLSEVLWFLHAHHEGEDALLYPLLVERAPESDALFSRMESQHLDVATNVQEAESAAESFGRSASADDGAALALACRSLLEEMAVHLDEEEAEVLPIASRTITPEEWGALPGHVLSQYKGTRIWLLLGLVFEAMPDDLCAHVIDNVPPPVSEMWRSFGSAAFDNEIGSIRAAAGRGN